MADKKSGDKPSEFRKRLMWRLKKHYRLVIMSDSNYEMKFSVKLTPMNVLFITSTLSLLYVVVIVLFILFTPVRYFFDASPDALKHAREIERLKSSTDSLMLVVERDHFFLNNLLAILRDDIDTSRSGYEKTDQMTDVVDLTNITPTDSILRAEMESRLNFGILTHQNTRRNTIIEELKFFPPVKGIVTTNFNKNHYGVDVVAAENSAIKSVLDGKVIFTGWTVNDGYVIALQHNNDLVSIYKHNSVVLKRTGNYVKAGDVIAVIGNTGEYSQGPHLHFELWHKMMPIDPLEFIQFK